MSDNGYITLTREIQVIQIPHGETVTLPAETQVSITQELGGSYTILAPSHGGLFRVQNQDADAIGREAVKTEIPATEGEFSITHVWATLRNCYDPEIPVNIVDLGLIYDVAATPDDSGKGQRVSVKMTLTAPGCGMGPTLARDAEQRILVLPGVASAGVELVWDPPWTPSLISPEGKMQLGIE